MADKIEEVKEIKHIKETDPAYPTPDGTQSGITLLQYYAGQAMIGRISSKDNYGSPEELAVFCFNYAQGMVDYERKLNEAKNA